MLTCSSMSVKSIRMRHDMTGDSGILFHIGAHIDALRTKLPGLRYRLRRMHTEFPGFIRAGCDNPAPLSILRIRSHNDRLPFVLGVIPLLHCRIESIHVHMQNRPAHRRKCSPAAAKQRNVFCFNGHSLKPIAIAMTDPDSDTDSNPAASLQKILTNMTTIASTLHLSESLSIIGIRYRFSASRP